MKKLLIVLAIFSTTILAQSNKTLVDENIPHLKKHGNSFQLIVNGKPHFNACR